MAAVKTLYIANKIGGVPRGNYDWFIRAAAYAREKGYKVVSPVEMNLDKGFDAEQAERVRHYTPEWRQFLREDAVRIAGECDGIAFGPLWQDSPGSKIEREIGYALGLEFWRIDPDNDILRPERLLGIAGLARSGKDTAANYLADFGWTRRAYADSLKAIAYACNPWVRVDNWEPPRFVRLRDYVDVFGWEDAKKSSDVREFLQLLGTEGGRENLSTDIWVRTLLMGGYADSLVVPDVRFPDEARAIEERGGIVIRIERPDVETIHNATHRSETALADYPFKVKVVNDGSIEELGQKVLAAVDDHYGTD